jgi:N-acetylmuramoyl-L-alanine amidase
MRHGFPLALRLTAALLVLVVLLPHDAFARTRHGQSRQLVVVLDPGHGGPDIGAASADGSLVEKILTLEVAKAAAKDLTQMGYKVFLTRTRDQSTNTPPRDLNGDGKIDHVDDLVARNVFANRHHADVFVAIHFDGGDPSLHGTHGYYCPARPFWKKSRLLALLLTKSLSRAFTRAGYPSPDNGVQTDVADIVPQARPDYPWFLQLGPPMRHFVIATTMPGALIETLYLSSPSDAAALHRPSIIAAAARGYAEGIQAYLQQERP